MQNRVEEDLSGLTQDSSVVSPTVIGARIFSGKLLTALILVVIPLIYFFPAVMGAITLVPGDGLTQNLGVRVLIGQMLRDGQIPLWNPYIYAGTPLLASIYPGVLYPPNWIFVLFSPATAMNIVVITTYHLSLIGGYLYARKVGMTKAGALFAGITFTFGGYMIAHMGHTSRIAAAAWLPWILLAIEELYQQFRWRWVVYGALFIALQLFAGEPQMNFYTILVCGAYGVYSLFLRARSETRFRFIFGAIAMSVCGLLLSMIQLIPERELLQLGERARISYEYFSGYSFSPGKIVTFIAPFFFGGGMIAPFHMEYWGDSTIDETCGYAGLVTILFVLVALFGAGRNSMIWFWGAIALSSLLLSFGPYLPFGLNWVLYNMPVYSLFRAQGRHMYEFTFSMGMLAGFGLSLLAQGERERLVRVARRAGLVFASLLALSAIAYCLFAGWLVSGEGRPVRPPALWQAEIYIPIAFGLVLLILLAMYARRPSGFLQGGFVVLLFADLIFFSVAFNYGWLEFCSATNKRIQDPPAVQFIKSRESAVNSFRIVSHSSKPYGNNYDQLNFPNVSIARGLQSVNGYDALRLPRQAAIAGDMGIDGLIGNPSVFEPGDASLNLLNVKYLLRDVAPAKDQPGRATSTVTIDGIEFDDNPIDLVLDKAKRFEAAPDPATASEFVIVTTMGESVHIPDETPVAMLRFHTQAGTVIEKEIRAGRDTAEWAYDRPDVRSVIKHRRPQIAESWPETGFEGHRYLARIPLDRSTIVKIGFEYLLPDAALMVHRAMLIDRETGTQRQLESMQFYSDRWRKLAAFDNVNVYENLKAMPRAWFVRKAAVAMSADVLKTIRSGKFKDGTPFDPAETVLFEKEDFGNRDIVLPACGKSADAAVRVTRYEPQRIEIETSNGEAGFLVLSEIYFRGWEAWIDGKRTPVEKVNYSLRGLSVPAGNHKIEYKFRAHSFWNGLSYSLLGVFFLLVGAGGGRFGGGRYLKRLEARLEGSIDRAGKLAKSGAARVWRRIRNPPFLLGFFALLLFIYGWVLIRHASYAVGGSDSSGYANIARSLLNGTLVRPVGTEVSGLPQGTEYLFFPLAYDRGPVSGSMVSFYPMGMPLQMAIASLVAGWERGPFLISPLAAAFCLLLMYLLARDLGLSRGYALAGASILAASVSFIFMALSPMSDLVTTMWSTLAIWAAVRARNDSRYAWLVGIAFAMAFLTRPTSVFLLPAIVILFGTRRELYLKMLLAGLPFALLFFAYNFNSYGHPLRTGYASIGLQNELLVAGVGNRFQHYVYWVSMTMSPLLVAGWAGLAVLPRLDGRVRGLLLLWFGSFFAFYCFYNVYDAWWYTRFLLPGYPALVLGAMLTAREVLSRLRRAAGQQASLVAGCALLLIVFGFEIHYVQRYNIFTTGKVDRVNAASVRWANSVMARDALVVSMQMSGAVDFYARRPILRWDLLPPEYWDIVKKDIASRGRPLYALLQEHEIEGAKKAVPGTWKEIGRMNPISLWAIEP